MVVAPALLVKPKVLPVFVVKIQPEPAVTTAWLLTLLVPAYQVPVDGDATQCCIFK